MWKKEEKKELDNLYLQDETIKSNMLLLYKFQDMTKEKILKSKIEFLHFTKKIPLKKLSEIYNLKMSKNRILSKHLKKLV